MPKRPHRWVKYSPIPFSGSRVPLLHAADLLSELGFMGFKGLLGKKKSFV